nr:MAG TPA: hypothetical protein [Caudoviricetes sp.]
MPTTNAENKLLIFCKLLQIPIDKSKDLCYNNIKLINNICLL